MLRLRSLANIAESTWSVLCKACRPLTLILLISSGILMQSCGYQWQRPLSIDQTLQPVYVSQSSPLGIAITRELAANGVKVSKHTSTANSFINTENNELEDRSLSIGNDGRSVEHLQRAQAMLVWRDKKNNAIFRAPLYADALRIAKPDTPLAQSTEEDQVNDRLTQSLAEQAISLIRHHLSSSN